MKQLWDVMINSKARSEVLAMSPWELFFLSKAQEDIKNDMFITILRGV